RKPSQDIFASSLSRTGWVCQLPRILASGEPLDLKNVFGGGARPQAGKIGRAVLRNVELDALACPEEHVEQGSVSYGKPIAIGKLVITSCRRDPLEGFLDDFPAGLLNERIILLARRELGGAEDEAEPLHVNGADGEVDDFEDPRLALDILG